MPPQEFSCFLSHRAAWRSLTGQDGKFRRRALAEVQDHLIQQAKDGNALALAALVKAVQDKVHRLSMRMLADPDGAQDATQEILIRVITKLSTFNGDSRFETWVYKVAMNYLITAKKIIARDPGLSFESFGKDLIDGLVDEAAASPEDQVMVNELRLRCTMAMLMCLDRKHRAAYVLGEILEMEHGEAADILSLAPATFRKQLSRSRASVQEFTAAHCGLANSAAPCSCPKRLPAALHCGRLGASPSPALANAPSYAAAKAFAGKLSAALVTAKLQRATGPLKAPEDFAARVLSLVDPP